MSEEQKFELAKIMPIVKAFMYEGIVPGMKKVFELTDNKIDDKVMDVLDNILSPLLEDKSAEEK